MNNISKNTRMTMLAIAMSLGCATGAMAMTSAEHKAQNSRIEADYKAARDKCGSLSANAKDICMSEAKGAEKVAKAELAVQYKPSAKNDVKVREAKADAAYDTAKEKCDDQTGNAKDVCVKDAKAAHTSALGAAKVADAGMSKTNGANAKTAKVAEARQEATADTRKAQYAAAKERCDAMSGNAKDACVADAKTKYGM
ncbi:MAG: hypothetical protein JWQ88_2606 [Rhodoferax sp.]|nr:hypothetical protein [Rhodoferax sp.]